MYCKQVRFLFFVSIMMTFANTMIFAEEQSPIDPFKGDIIISGNQFIASVDSRADYHIVDMRRFPVGQRITDAVLGKNNSELPLLYYTVNGNLLKIHSDTPRLAFSKINSESELIKSVVFDVKRNAPASMIKKKERSKHQYAHIGLRTIEGDKRLPTNIKDCTFIYSKKLPFTLTPGAHYSSGEIKHLFPKQRQNIELRPQKREWILRGQSLKFSTYLRIPELPDEEQESYVNSILIEDRETQDTILVDDLMYYYSPFTYSKFVFLERQTIVYVKDSGLFEETAFPGSGLILFQGGEPFIECTYDQGLTHVGASDDAVYLSKGTELYRIKISPKGCSTPEKVMSLPFEPQRLFVLDTISNTDKKNKKKAIVKD